MFTNVFSLLYILLTKSPPLEIKFNKFKGEQQEMFISEDMSIFGVFQGPIFYAETKLFDKLTGNLAQLAGAIEYNDCTPTAPHCTPHVCPSYDTKQSDGEVPVMLGL